MRLLPLLLLCFLIGCDGAGPLDPAPAKSRLEDMIFARKRGDAQAMEAVILPERREALRITLDAMDGYREVAELFEQELRERVGAEFAKGVQVARMGRYQAVLSDNVTLLDASEDPQQPGAVRVAYMRDETPPARYARMVEHNGQWWYDPGEGFDPQLPQAFDLMRDALQQLLDELQNDPQASARIGGDPQAFLDDLSERLAPGMRLLPR